MPALIAGLAAIATLVAACGAPPGPAGWAPARPVKVDSAKFILVPHRSKLFALPDGSTNPAWQFPPAQKDGYPVSTDTHNRLTALVDALSVDAAVKTDLKRKVDDLAVGGASRGVLKDGVDATGASQNDKDALKSLVDSTTKFERGSLDSLQALYGDIGISADGKTAYVPTFRGRLFALDVSTGRTRWVRDAGAGFVGGVAVDGDRLYVGTRANRVYQINAATGESSATDKSLWQATTKGEVWATPTVDGDTLYVTSLDGSLYALDKATGKQKWTFNSASSGIAGRAVVSGSTVYVGAFDNKVYAINTSDGTQKWSTSGGNWFWASR